MPQKAPGHRFRTDKGLFAVMALTVPCPVSILFCNGLLPLTALGGFVGAAAVRAPRDPGYFIMTPLAIEGLVYLWLMWWTAGRLAARMSPRGRRVAVAGLVVLGLLPVYFFDCMDGHALTRCSVIEMARGLIVSGRQCGDLGW